VAQEWLMSRAQLFLCFVTLIFLASLNAAARYSPQLAPKLQSAGTSSPLSGVGNPTAYSVPDHPTDTTLSGNGAGA
jgi:hypothetical protein